MKKNIVADTNVWYLIANGNYQVLHEINSHLGNLCVTPLSLFEIISKINESNFEIRKKAAHAVLQYANEYLQSNEFYLDSYFGCRYTNSIVDWKNGFKMLAEAKSVQELKVITLFHKWREYHYKDFKTKVIQAVQTVHPKYIINPSSSQPKIKKVKNSEIIEFINDPTFFEATLRALYNRMQIGIKLDNARHLCPDIPNEILFQHARNKLTPYIKAYAEYLKYLMCEGALPQENDLGDHENFMYLQDDNWVLATADKRWVNIGLAVSPKQIINLHHCLN